MKRFDPTILPPPSEPQPAPATRSRFDPSSLVVLPRPAVAAVPEPKKPARTGAASEILARMRLFN